MDLPVNTQWIEIAPGFAGFLALPPAGTGPGLVLWQEIFGVNAHIRGVAEQYALDGFVVLAPDVFWRQAPRVELGYGDAERPRAMGLMQGLAPADAKADIAAAVAALRARPEVAGAKADAKADSKTGAKTGAKAGAKVGGIGYCAGGRMAFVAAATAGIDAAVAYYGGGIHQQLDLAPAVACPTQFHYAGLDDHIPPDAVERVRAAMAGRDAEVFVYPGAQHGFNCWARGAYHPASAALAHGRATAFLARCLHG